MKQYIYLFITIFLLFIITLNVVNTYQEGYTGTSKPQKGGGITSSPAMGSPTASTYQNINDVNVVFHDSVEDIQKQMGTDPYANTITVLDKSGKLVQVPISETANDTTYYEEASLRYEPSNFVPTYEDTVYFSKLTGLGYQKPIYGTDSQWGGFCTFNKDFPDKIEEKCGKLDGDTCASTSCCVLLGNKCVAGNENGPRLKSHYQEHDNDHTDKYFFMGKCYGNCIDDQSNYYNYNNEILSKNDDPIHKLNLKAGIYDSDDMLTNWAPGQTVEPNLKTSMAEAAAPVVIQQPSNTPSKAVVSESALKEPTKPVASEPVKAGAKEPTKPVASEPVKAGAKEPTKPVASEPVKAGAKEPTKPVASEPVKAGAKNPTGSVTPGSAKPTAGSVKPQANASPKPASKP
jgi:hypothetical protein